MQRRSASTSQPLWRRFSDEAYASLLRDWLTGEAFARTLKTDLYDESVTDGLVATLVELSEVVHGIDLSGDVVRAARRRYPTLAGCRADVRRLPYADGTLDLVISNSTLDHFETHCEIGLSLAEIHRVLRPGGRLLITLDNLANPIVAIRRALPFRLFNRLGVLPYYNGVTVGPAGLRRHLTGAGFVVERESPLMHVPRLPAVWACGLADGRISERTARRLIDRLLHLEQLSRFPTRHLTGYYVAALARR